MPEIRSSRNDVIAYGWIWYWGEKTPARRLQSGTIEFHFARHRWVEADQLVAASFEMDPASMIE